ncbi:hypothetical protein [Nocardia huaxiensis]|uniref:hypothetical protein n=1 Tax=Nocardia huaxiensis TaxID=2755382 RepID=UPI001E2F00CA|nr:hypothetical protein [Nocardia huaxiensis]UFS94382.1 hypothetical protein LPY97_26955 [Nocardia huaxiensis]
MKYRLALTAIALGLPLLAGAGNAHAEGIPLEPVAVDSGSALLDTDLATQLGTGSGQLARALLTGSSQLQRGSNADIAGSGSGDLASSGSALGNDVLTTGSAQALIGPGSALSDLVLGVMSSGSGKGWLQGFGSHTPVG